MTGVHALLSVEARLVSGLRAGGRRVACLRVQAPHPHRPGGAQRGVRRPRAVDRRVLLPRPPPGTQPVNTLHKLELS